MDISSANDDSKISNSGDSTSLREDIVRTAIKFLRNPNIQKSPLSSRQAFLKRKGLTDFEIQVACERAGYSHSPDHNAKHTSIAIPAQQSYIVPVQSKWSNFREVLQSIAFLGGISYGIYLLYKKYIEPLLFGEQKKKKSLDQCIAELSESVKRSVSELHSEVKKVQHDVNHLAEQQQTEKEDILVKQIKELKNEISSVKGLLLSRNQFPPAAASASPPSIPSWQLSSEAARKDGPDGDGDVEDRSGSGCSETEGVTNNGSDSSLEMIRETS